MTVIARSMNNGFCPPSTAPVGESFDEVVLPHLDAAYRLARWLMRNETRCGRCRAGGVAAGPSILPDVYRRKRARLVPQNCSQHLLRLARPQLPAATDPFDEEQHSSARPASDPETLLLQTDDVTLIERAMSNLPDRFRELLVLRELEGLSYRELADVMDIPMGTVMSGLSRARQAFRGALDNELKPSGIPKRTHLREQEADEVLV